MITRTEIKRRLAATKRYRTAQEELDADVTLGAALRLIDDADLDALAEHGVDADSAIVARLDMAARMLAAAGDWPTWTEDEWAVFTANFRIAHYGRVNN